MPCTRYRYEGDENRIYHLGEIEMQTCTCKLQQKRRRFTEEMMDKQVLTRGAYIWGQVRVGVCGKTREIKCLQWTYKMYYLFILKPSYNKYLRLSCQMNVHRVPSTLVFRFPKIKAVAVKAKIQPCTFRPYLSLPIALIIFFIAKRSDLELHIAFSCHVSLISYNLEQFLSLY